MLVDYRKILSAYIDNVGCCEGVNFLPAELDRLTAEENIALHEAALEIDDSTERHKNDLREMIYRLRAK